MRILLIFILLMSCGTDVPVGTIKNLKEPKIVNQGDTGGFVFKNGKFVSPRQIRAVTGDEDA